MGIACSFAFATSASLAKSFFSTSQGRKWRIALLLVIPVISLFLIGWMGRSSEVFLWSLIAGLCVTLLDTFWYPKISLEVPTLLDVGNILPAVEAYDMDDRKVSSDDVPGALLLMFIRGNWCPLCVTQVRKVAALYRELAERGVQVIVISPQPEENTRALAKGFDAPLHFLVDRNHQSAKALGIFHPEGVFKGMELRGYESDTVRPTLLITDENRKILYSDITANYRIRPEPEDFLRVLDLKETKI